MTTKIYFTDRLSNLYLDQITDNEYVIVGGYVWESLNAGDVLIKTIGEGEEVEFIKRE